MPLWSTILMGIMATFGSWKLVKYIIDLIRNKSKDKISADNDACVKFEERMKNFIALYGDNMDLMTDNLKKIQELQLELQQRDIEISLLKESVLRLTTQINDQGQKITEQYLLINELKGLVRAYTCENLDCPHIINHTRF